jgi:hypothetical protein
MVEKLELLGTNKGRPSRIHASGETPILPPPEETLTKRVAASVQPNAPGSLGFAVF